MKVIYCIGHLKSCAFPFFQHLKSFFTRQKNQPFQDNFQDSQPFFPRQNKKSLFWAKLSLIWLIVREPIVTHCTNSTLTWSLQCLEIDELEDLNLSTKILYLCSRKYYSECIHERQQFYASLISSLMEKLVSIHDFIY